MNSRFVRIGWIVFVGLLLYGITMPSSLGQQVEAPDTNVFEGMSQYSVVNDEGESIGSAYIYKELVETEFGSYFSKTVNIDFAATDGNLSYELQAGLDGRLQKVNFRRTTLGKIDAEYTLSAEGRDVSFSVAVGGADVVNAQTTMATDVPVLAYLNQAFVRKGTIEAGVKQSFARFNFRTRLFDIVDVKLRTFEEEDAAVPEGVAALEVKLDSSKNDYALSVKRMLIGLDGSLYRLDFIEGYSMILETESGDGPQDEDTDWYNIKQDRKKVGFAKVSRKPVVKNDEKHLEVSQTMWIVEGGQTYRWVERYLFNVNLQLVSGNVQVYQASSKIIDMDVDVKKNVLASKGKDLARQTKISKQERDWAPETICYSALGEFFRTYAIDPELPYSFTALVPAFRTTDDEVKLRFAHVQFKFTKRFTMDVNGESVDLTELSATVNNNPSLLWIDTAGRVYRFDRFSEFDFSSVGVFEKTSQQDAVNFKPDNNYSYTDEEDKFHFKIGFRRDPFIPVIPSAGSTGKGNPITVAPIAEEERLYADLSKLARELEDAVEAKNFNTATNIILALETGLTRNWYWPSVRAKAEKLKTKVRQLKEKNGELVEEIRRRLAQAKVDSASLMLVPLQKAFDDKDYPLVFRIADQIHIMLTTDSAILSAPAMAGAVNQILNKAKGIRDSAEALEEFAKHENEIKINGVIVGEEPHIALINNNIIAHVGDQVLVIRDEMGNESGKVYVAYIEIFGVTFKYKGQEITKGFETVIK